MNFIFKLMQAMEDHGIFIRGNVNPHSDRFQRFKSRDKGKGKDIFVKLLDGGAVFGDWHNKDNYVTWWENSFSSLSREEKIKRSEQIDLAKERSRMEQELAIRRANQLWNHPSLKEISQHHPYIKAKKIIPYYGRQCRSWIILPVRDIHDNLQSLQYISKDCKRKRFKKGAIQREGFMLLGERIFPTSDVRICEGWATACSIHEATGHPTVCAFNADNLLNVAIVLRQKYPYINLKICADNDQWKEKNTGIDIGRRASQLTGASLHYPEFKPSNHEKKPTDFNDLFCLEGLEELEIQLNIVRK